MVDIQIRGNILVIDKKKLIYLNKIDTVYKGASGATDGYIYFSEDGKEPKNLLTVLKSGFTYSPREEGKIMNILDESGIKVRNVRGGMGSTSQSNKKSSNRPTVNRKKCPQCESTNLEFMQNNRKKFSVGKAVGGALLTGGIGAIAGFAGKDGKKDTWHCKKYGNVFE